MLTEELKQKIRDELKDDLERYDGDYIVWSDVVCDYPSDTLQSLAGDDDDTWAFVCDVVREMNSDN